jgi:hypothetical protein
VFIVDDVEKIADEFGYPKFQLTVMGAWMRL